MPIMKNALYKFQLLLLLLLLLLKVELCLILQYIVLITSLDGAN